MIQTSSLVYPLSGLLVGLIVGLTGVGGGSLMTPLLLAFGVHPTTAVGTDLLYAATTKTVGTAVHNAGETVDWRIVRRLCVGSVPGTLITMFLLVAHRRAKPARDRDDQVRSGRGSAADRGGRSFCARYIAEFVARGISASLPTGPRRS